jgi:hypothetical protein
VTILAFDPNRRTNAQAIYDAYELGYITNDDFILDMTYGEGAFWKLWAPPAGQLVRNDLDEFKGDVHEDFRDTTFFSDHFDVVVFDPPYGFRGTSKHPMDAQYGLGEYLTVDERLTLMRDGMKEAARLVKPKGIVLFKLQDQVVSGEKVWQRMLFANYGETIGLELVDELHVVGYRAQPQRKCKRCAGVGRVSCPGPSTEPKTQRGRDEAGLVKGVDYCYGMHMGHDCPDCGGSGKVDMVQKHSASNVSTLQCYRKVK